MELKKTQKNVKRLKKRINIIPNVNRSLEKHSVFGIFKNNVIIIYAKRNKKITKELLETMKKDLNSIVILGSKINKLFQIVTKIRPNVTFTQKGILVRMGKGKGKIKTIGLYLVSGTICFQLIPISNKAIIPQSSRRESIRSVSSNPSRIGSNRRLVGINKFIKKYTFLNIKYI